LIGIDIGTYSIKICLIEKRTDSYHVIAAFMARNQALREGVKQDDISQNIKAMLKKAGLEMKNVVASIGSTDVVSRNLTFPKLTAPELAGAVRFEAKQSTSIDLNAMYTDFSVLTTDKSGASDVLFVAAPKDRIDKQSEILRNNGLNVAVMDIDNTALANTFLAFDANPAKESVVLLNIGHTYSNITIMDNDELRFVRNLEIGGKDVTREIANCLEIPPEKAEEIKKRPDVWDTLGLNIKNILRKSTPDLLEAVYRSMDYCCSRKKLISVDKILLCGGTSYLPGLESFIAEALGIHTERWNPLLNLDLPENSKKELGQFLGVALGLAVRDEKIF
jgi:type IV pilus assembly protein PilM